MKESSILDAIGTVGFPIVCVLLLGYLFYKVLMWYLENNKEIFNKVMDMNNKNSETIKENTTTMQEVVTFLKVQQETMGGKMDLLNDNIQDLKTEISKRIDKNV